MTATEYEIKKAEMKLERQAVAWADDEPLSKQERARIVRQIEWREARPKRDARRSEIPDLERILNDDEAN